MKRDYEHNLRELLMPWFTLVDLRSVIVVEACLCTYIVKDPTMLSNLCFPFTMWIPFTQTLMRRKQKRTHNLGCSDKALCQWRRCPLRLALLATLPSTKPLASTTSPRLRLIVLRWLPLWSSSTKFIPVTMALALSIPVPFTAIRSSSILFRRCFWISTRQQSLEQWYGEGGG